MARAHLHVLADARKICDNVDAFGAQGGRGADAAELQDLGRVDRPRAQYHLAPGRQLRCRDAQNLAIKTYSLKYCPKVVMHQPPCTTLGNVFGPLLSLLRAGLLQEISLGAVELDSSEQALAAQPMTPQTSVEGASIHGITAHMASRAVLAQPRLMNTHSH